MELVETSNHEGVSELSVGALSDLYGVSETAVRNQITALEVIGFVQLVSEGKKKFIRPTLAPRGGTEFQPVEQKPRKERKKRHSLKDELGVHEWNKFLEHFWSLYPKRNGEHHGVGFANIALSRLYAGQLPDLMMAVRNYAASKQAQEGYALNAVKWLSKDEWRTWINRYPIQRERKAVL